MTLSNIASKLLAAAGVVSDLVPEKAKTAGKYVATGARKAVADELSLEFGSIGKSLARRIGSARSRPKLSASGKVSGSSSSAVFNSAREAIVDVLTRVTEDVEKRGEAITEAIEEQSASIGEALDELAERFEDALASGGAAPATRTAGDTIETSTSDEKKTEESWSVMDSIKALLTKIKSGKAAAIGKGLIGGVVSALIYTLGEMGIRKGLGAFNDAVLPELGVTDEDRVRAAEMMGGEDPSTFDVARALVKNLLGAEGNSPPGKIETRKLRTITYDARLIEFKYDKTNAAAADSGSPIEQLRDYVDQNGGTGDWPIVGGGGEGGDSRLGQYWSDLKKRMGIGSDDGSEAQGGSAVSQPSSERPVDVPPPPDGFKSPVGGTDLNDPKSVPYDGGSKNSRSFGGRRGYNKLHTGVDIPGSVGDPIYAVKDGGVIRRAEKSSSGYGYVVDVEYPDGTVHRNAHMNGILDGITVGKKVKAGEVIGQVGHSGNADSSFPHNHYEVIRKDYYDANGGLPPGRVSTIDELNRGRIDPREYYRQGTDAEKKLVGPMPSQERAPPGPGLGKLVQPRVVSTTPVAGLTPAVPAPVGSPPAQLIESPPAVSPVPTGEEKRPRIVLNRPQSEDDEDDQPTQKRAAVENDAEKDDGRPKSRSFSRYLGVGNEED